MNTQSNAISESHAESNLVKSVDVSLTRLVYCLVRREIWENRSLYLAPLVVACVIVFSFSLSSVAGIWEAQLRLGPTEGPAKLAFPYTFAALLLMGTTAVVAIFYCLDALHGERRDRSILFWKSLPVSDLVTVLSKAMVPIIVLPLVTFVVTLATQWIMLMTSTVAVAAHGDSVRALWSHLPFFPMSMMLLYHLVAVHGLWYAPIYSWLLLVSAWARRAVFLWAGLPLLAVGIVEKLAFNSARFGGLLAYRLGGMGDAPFTAETLSMPMTHIHLGQFLINPGLWTGLLLAAVFLGLAVRLRRLRGPI
jgi:ABC-2 type transport system permease protein